MATTTYFSLEYPDGADGVDVAGSFLTFADDVDTAMYTLLPKAGGTLTGALLGTTLSLSSTLAVTGTITGSSSIQAAASSGFILGASGPKILSGAGDPEGAVTAPMGSVWLRNDGSTSTTLYIKTSGAGNTGWTAK